MLNRNKGENKEKPIGRTSERAKERIVWNNLKARHYAILILLSIVTIETSAIAVDKFFGRGNDVAFQLETHFQNNNFIERFQTAEARARVDGLKKVDPAIVPLQKADETDKSAEAAVATKQTVEAPFVAAGHVVNKPERWVEYSVKRGDSLSGIANLFGTSLEAIKTANNLTSGNSFIKAGQTLKLPVNEPRMLYTVQPGDSLSKVANRFGISMESLVESNELKTHILKADQKLTIPVKFGKPELTMIRSSAGKSVDNSGSAGLSSGNNNPGSNNMAGLLKTRDLKIAANSIPALELVDDKSALLIAPPKVQAKKAIDAKKVNTVVAETGTAPQAETAVASSENKTLHHVVEKGESLSLISRRYETTIAQLVKDNRLNNTLIHVGQKLLIQPSRKLYTIVKEEGNKNLPAVPPVASSRLVEHTIEKGDNLSSLAKKYNTTVAQIVKNNNLRSTMLKVGQKLDIPENQKLFKVSQISSTRSTALSARWPLKGRISDKFGWRKHPVYKKRLFHAGIDIAAPRGTPINAALDGEVIFSGWKKGYGKLVVLRHKNGYTTRYGHCSTIRVSKGKKVRAGELIARVGATGVATGNHLHFEVRKDGKALNPQQYLGR